MPRGFIPPHGGYKKLLSYQRAEIVYDATVRFCARYFERRDRTVDQMVQAARSGKQNIIEGSMASATSKETEIKLTNVARASLEELLEDYRDFLRCRNLAEWPKDHRFARRLSQLLRAPGADYSRLKDAVENPDPAITANSIIGIIKVTTFLLDRQIRQLEQAFIEEGGLRERMTRARLDHRQLAHRSEIPRLRTKRLLLREWLASDLGPFAELNADPEVMEFFPSALTRADSDAAVERIRAHFNLHGFGWWAAELVDSGTFIGFIGLAIPTFEAHFTPCVEIGWRLARPYWGRGYAPEGAAAALRFAFEELKLSEVVSFTARRNARSQRVMQKLGMTHASGDDFDHPMLPPGHQLRPHVLYRRQP